VVINANDPLDSVDAFRFRDRDLTRDRYPLTHENLTDLALLTPGLFFHSLSRVKLQSAIAIV
jgi:hypothetical protein